MENNDKTKTAEIVQTPELELSWIMKIRIIMVLTIGVVVLGVTGFKYVMPATPLDMVTIVGTSVTASDILICVGLAFAAGVIAAVIAAPFGKQIATLAAPAGLAYWAIKSGSLATAFQMSPAAGARTQIYAEMKFAGFAWLAIAASGYLGAMLTAKIMPKGKSKPLDKFEPVVKLPYFLVVAITVIATVFIAHFVIGIIARDISYPDARLGSVTGSPSNLQIALAVTVGFAVAGFLAKTILGADATWIASATVPLVYYISTTYSRPEILSYMSQYWSAMFFARPPAAVLPIQVVSFGCIGAVIGYWLAVRTHIWRTHKAYL